MTDKPRLDGNHEIAFSYSKSHFPSKPYNSSGEYLWFREINIEERARVKHISLISGKYTK